MMPVDRGNIGYLLKTRMLQLGFRQKDLADMLEISQKHVSLIVRGKADMSFVLLMQILEVLGLSMVLVPADAVEQAVGITKDKK